MSLAEYLRKDRAALLERWARQAESVYAFDTAGFVRSAKDARANPVGQRTREAARALFAALLAPEPDPEALVPPLEEFLRVRAVQDIAPEQALAVLFAFKPLARECLAAASATLDDALRRDLDRLDARVDDLALLAFGIYSRCRERLFQLRLRDMRRRSDVFARLARQRNPDLQDARADLDPPAGARPV